MTTLAEDRREEFKKNIAELKLDKKQAGGDAATRIAGLVLMVVGVVGAFVVYISSLTLSDLRDLVSYQILTVVFLALTVSVPHSSWPHRWQRCCGCGWFANCSRVRPRQIRSLRR